MKTLANISTIRNKLPIVANVRLNLIIMGIATAIICFLVLLHDVHSVPYLEIKASGSTETLKLTNANLLVKAASTILSF